MAGQGFRKRYYRRPSSLWRDVVLLARERGRIKALQRGDPLDKAFQERLMLMVTEVNGCRYCAYAHARMALSAGLSRADVDALSRGSLEGAPAEQVPALLYAQHWAEAEAQPDPQVRQQIVEAYGLETTKSIELSLRMIRVGNLLGNTADYILYRASFGCWGGG